MVRSITSNGTLKFALLGGPIAATLDSEYCKIRTRDGKIYTGTILSTSPAAHVYSDAKDKKRNPENIFVVNLGFIFSLLKISKSPIKAATQQRYLFQLTKKLVMVHHIFHQILLK